MLPALLEHLSPMRRQGIDVVLADGGSTDRTPALAACAGIRVVHAARGRAYQMNAGAAQARGTLLLFLHADTRLPTGFERLVRQALADGRHAWGRFDVRLDAPGWVMRATESGMNRRSRLTGIATGDQALFMTRAAFDAVGGFPDQPLMEDVEISRRLLRLSRPACLAARAVTSARRWQEHGVWRTILLMWWLRFRYWLGASPAQLARYYR